MTEQQIDALVRVAADTAMRAAADYIRLHEIVVDDYEHVTQVLQSEVKYAIGPALEEVKAAFAANMGHVAVATFRASMMAAGIKAAKEFSA